MATKLEQGKSRLHMEQTSIALP